MLNSQDEITLPFLTDGEMSDRIRAFDWSRTPLGEAARWPQALKTLVGLMLVSQQPMFMAWGPKQTWLYNDAFITIMGNKHPRGLGCHALDEVWSEAREVLAPLFDRVFAGSLVQMDDFVLLLDRRGRLEEAHFSFSYNPIRDQSGRVAGLFGICTETTALLLAERRRAAEQARQRRLFEQAPSFMCILEGPQHVFTFVNHAHRRLFNSADWVGKPVREAFPDLANQGYYERLDEVYVSGKRYVAQSAPVRYRRSPDESLEERLLDFIYEPVSDDEGRVTGIFCEGFDVTEARRTEQTLRESEAQLRESEAQLREADRRKDAFLATLAHELRNPLAPIRQAVLVAKSPTATATQLRWSLDVIERQSIHMALLLDDLLDVSRITRGQLPLRRERVELAQVISAAIETARPLIEARGHELRLDLPASPLRFDVDALRLSQVISNLLTNAAKYTDKGGRIELSVRTEKDRIIISVSDSGMGIEAEVLPSLFEMFSQAKSALDRAEGGLGIGLALVKGIVTMHGGSVEARSAGPGHGSEFIVSLPHAEDGEEPPARKAPPKAPPVAPRRIVVADDNRDAAESLKMLLELGGHDVRLAHDGSEALEAANSARPDIMLLDIGMPKLNGYEVARSIRSQPWGAGIVLVAITGWGQAEDRDRALQAGFDRHLTKPLSYDSLKSLLALTKP